MMEHWESVVGGPPGGRHADTAAAASVVVHDNHIRQVGSDPYLDAATHLRARVVIASHDGQIRQSDLVIRSAPRTECKDGTSDPDTLHNGAVRPLDRETLPCDGDSFGIFSGGHAIRRRHGAPVRPAMAGSARAYDSCQGSSSGVPTAGV